MTNSIWPDKYLSVAYSLLHGLTDCLTARMRVYVLCVSVSGWYVPLCVRASRFASTRVDEEKLVSLLSQFHFHLHFHAGHKCLLAKERKRKGEKEAERKRRRDGRGEYSAAVAAVTALIKLRRFSCVPGEASSRF